MTTKQTEAIVAAGAILLATCLMLFGQMPPMPAADDAPGEPVLYQTKLAWDPHPSADAFSLIVAGRTNVTTMTEAVVTTPEGKWPVELRAHRGSLSSEPVATNLAVTTATWLRVVPAARTNLGPLVPSVWPTNEINTARLPTNVFIGFGAIIVRRGETNRSLLP